MQRLIVAIGLVAASTWGVTRPSGQPAPDRTVSGFIQNGDVQLSYQLDRPAGAGPFPAVVIGHGSGRTTKQSCLGLAMRMRERGFATLCYDKRGVGLSTGTYSMVGSGNSPTLIPELASDMAAAVGHLRKLRDIDGKRVGLLGPSQAGWIIPEAARLSSPAFMIILVGPTVSTGEEIFYSRFAEGTTTSLEDAYAKLPEFKGPHGFDPRPVLERLSVPGLWLLGGADRSIPTPKTVKILEELVAAGRPFTFHVYPGVDHDLRGAPVWTDIDRWLPKIGILPARQSVKALPLQDH